MGIEEGSERQSSCGQKAIYLIKVQSRSRQQVISQRGSTKAEKGQAGLGNRQEWGSDRQKTGMKAGPLGVGSTLYGLADDSGKGTGIGIYYAIE